MDRGVCATRQGIINYDIFFFVSSSSCLLCLTSRYGCTHAQTPVKRPANLSGAEGVQLLSPREYDLCLEQHIMPRAYVFMKEAMVQQHNKQVRGELFVRLFVCLFVCLFLFVCFSS